MVRQTDPKNFSQKDIIERELATVFNVCICIYIYCEGYGSYLYNCVEGNYHLDTESLVGDIIYIYIHIHSKNPINIH